MKRILLVSVLMMLATMSLGQNRKVVVQGFDTNVQDMRARTAPRFDNNDKMAAIISVVSSDSVAFKGNIIGDPIFLPGETIIYMPGGAGEVEIIVKDCKPIRYSFPAQLLSAYSYKMELISVPISQLRTLILPGYSYNYSQKSYSMMMAICDLNGGFIRAKTDFNFGLNPVYTCTDKGYVDNVKEWFSGKTTKSRLAITAGYVRRILDPLYLYAGGGYGIRTLAWEMYVNESTKDWARVEQASFSGFEADFGMVVYLRGAALSIGVQTNMFKYYELNAGIGIMI